MNRAFVLFVVVALGACFSPSFHDTTCGVNDECPPGLMCVDGVCRSEGVPTDAPPAATLTITRTGDGTVTSTPAGVDCGATCTGTFAIGTEITLTAAPGTGGEFTGWGGGTCSGTSPTCTLTLADDTTVTADFALTMHTVTVVRGGNGGGTVTSVPTGITCGATCTTSVTHGTSVTLTAVAASDSIFLGWSGGGCSGTSTCVLDVTSDVSVNASFGLNFSVVVSKTGNGSGGVTSSPTGINCGADCDEVYTAGTVVTLTANASVTSNFSGWSGGGCSGTGTCVVTVTAAVAVNADFALKRYTLTTTVAGLGGGTITSSPAGITCGADCSELYDHGTAVSLTATPNGVSSFTGWSGACTGTGACNVTMDMARSVTATFAQQTSGFNVTKNGTGTGTVTSSPAGITCGADCSETYPLGTVVTLTATPGVGSTLTAWSGGGCTGTGSTCVVTTTAALTVTATFTLNQYTLTVAKAGNGTGTVTGTGINCGVLCTATLDHGTMNTLTAAPAAGTNFTGWSGGGCSGTGTCTVTMTAALTVTATFTLNQYTLTVSKPGNGFGTVTATGISCGADCSEAYSPATVVTLTAVAAATPLSQDSTFTGWSGGGCSGTGTCTVTMNANTTVVATFTLDPNYAFVTSTMTNGNMGGLTGADSICQGNANAAGIAGTFKAWLSSSTVSAASRLGTASGWVRRDGKPFARSQADLLAGREIYPLRIVEDGSDAGYVKTFTGSTMAGGISSLGGSCLNWTATDSVNYSAVGHASGYGEVWTQAEGFACSSTTLRLSCLGIDRVAPIAALPAATGRRAFVSNGFFDVATGIAAADAICNNEATAAGLSGTYRALLATSGASAASRFNTLGTIIRPDNAVVSAGTTFFTTALWDSAINLTAAGNYVSNSNVSALIGASSFNAAGTAATTCNNWSAYSGTTIYGGIGDTAVVEATGSGPILSGTISCTASTTIRVYCLQQ